MRLDRRYYLIKKSIQKSEKKQQQQTQEKNTDNVINQLPNIQIAL